MASVTRNVAFVILLPLVFLIWAPFLYVVAAVFFLIRTVLTIVNKTFKLGGGEFLKGWDGVFASENPYKKPKMVVVIGAVLNGTATLAEVREKMADVVLQLDKEGYTRLKEYLTKWMGFVVWKQVTDYRIEDHVLNLEPETIKSLLGQRILTHETKTQLLHEIQRVPFQKMRSPWELYLCPISAEGTSEGEGSFLIFRFHHALGDGVAAGRVTSKLLNTEADHQNLIRAVQQGSVDKSLSWNLLKETMVSIYKLTEILAYRTDFNDFHKPWTGVRKKYTYQTVAVPIEKVKRVRKAQNVSFSAVVGAIQTMALRRLFQDRKARVPDAIHVMVSVPMDVLNSQTRNNISAIVLKYPTGEPDSRKICEIIDKDLREQKNPHFSYFMYQISSLISLLPQSLKFFYPGWLLHTMGGTNLPAGQLTKTLGSHQVTWCAGISQMRTNLAIYFFIMGYQENLLITIGISKDIMPDHSNLNQFMAYLDEELDKLAQTC